MMRQTLLAFISIVFSLHANAQCALTYPSAIAICQSQNTVINPITINGYNSFSWTGMSGISNSTQQNPTLNTTVSGTLTLTATNAGCTPSTKTISIAVTVIQPPVIQIVTNQPVCSGSNVTAQITNPQTGVSYSWTFPGNATAIGTNVTKPVSVLSGNGTINSTITVTANLNGTSCSSQQTIAVKQAPDAVFSDFYNPNPFANCNNSNQVNFTLTNSSSTASTNAQYQVNWGDAQSQNLTGSSWLNGSEITHIYTGQGNFPIEIIVSGNNGCSSTFTQFFFNGSNPADGLGNPGSTTNLCAPRQLSFPFNVAVFSNTPGTIYKFWVNDNTDTTTLVHPNPPAVLQSGYSHLFSSSSCSGGNGTPTSFKVFMKSINGCNPNPQPSIITNITVYPKAEAGFDMPAQTCINSSFVLTNTTTGGFQSVGNACANPYLKWEVLSPSSQWTLNSGNLGNGFPPPNNVQTGSNSISLSFSQLGTHTIRLIAKNGACGNDTLEKTVCILPLPQSIVTVLPASGCSPLAVNTTNSSTGSSSCGVLTHSWAVQPSTGWSFTNGTTSQSTEPKFSFTAPGNYTVSHTVTNGCTPSTTTYPVTIISPPTVNINPITPNCAPAIVSPTATISNGGGTISNYAWTFPNGNPSSNSTANPGDITYNTPGPSNIQLSVTNECGTVNSNLQITIPNPPLTPVITSNSPLCEGQTLNLSVTSTPGIVYQWTGPGGFSQTGDNISLSNFQPTQAGIYSVTASAGACISAPATTNVTIIPSPIITLLPSNPLLCFGDSIILVASGASIYNWTPAAGLSATSGSSVTAFPTNTSLYTVTGTLAGNVCPGTSTINVTVNNPPLVFAGNDTSFCNQASAVSLSGFTPSINGSWFSVDLNGLNSSGSFIPDSSGVFTAFYTYTDLASGCLGKDSLVISVSNPQPIEIGIGNSFCQFDPPAQLSPSNGNWIINNSPLPTGIFNPIQPGTFSAIYSQGQGSCQVSDTMQITVNPLPDLTTIPPSGICLGQASEVLFVSSNTADTFKWFVTGSPLIIGATTNVTVSPTQTTDYTAEATISASGCAIRDTVTVTVSPSPVASFSIDLEFCSTEVIQPINTSQPANIQYTWFLDGPIQDTLTGVSPNVVNALNGTYSIKLVASIGTCSDTTTAQTFMVYEPPIVSVSTGNYSLCQSNGIPIQATVTGPESSYNFSWQFGNFLTSNLENPGLIDFPAPQFSDTLINYSLTVSSNLCPAVTDTGTVELYVAPRFDFFLDQVEGCSIFQLQAPATFIGSPDSVILTLQNGTTTSNLQEVFSFSAVNGTQVYEIYGRASNSCGAASDTMRVVVLPNPVRPQIISDLPLQGACAGIFATFVSSSVGSPDSILSYRWFVNGTQVSAGTPVFSYSFLEPGTTYTISLSVSDGCSDSTITIPINVLKQPEINLVTNETAGCIGSDFSLAVIASDSPFTQWFSGDGQVFYGDSVSYSYPLAGNYILLVIGSDSTGSCTAQDSATIIVYPDPTVQAFVDAPGICQNDWIRFSSISSGASNYNWTFGNGASSIFTSDSTRFAIPGDYYAQLIVSNFGGCTASDSVRISVRPKPLSIPKFSSLASEPLCGVPINIQLENLSIGAFSYRWYLNGVYTSNLEFPQLTLDSIGTSNVSLIAYSAAGCPDTAQVNVEVFEKPALTLAINPNQGCKPLVTNIDPDCSNCTSLEVRTSDLLIGSDLPFQYNWELEGDYEVQLIGSTAEGCRDTLGAGVNVFPIPVSAFTITPGITDLGGETFTLTDLSQPPENLNYFLYSNEVLIANSWIDKYYEPPLAENTTGLEYILVVVNENGCADTSRINVLLNNDGIIYFPNSFTPNGNEANDFFWPKGINIKTVNLSIYDRWGCDIYSSGDQPFSFEGWNGVASDGCYNRDGNKHVGSYVYTYLARVVFTNNKEKRLRGSVTLVH
jgi:PKD repeat protein